MKIQKNISLKAYNTFGIDVYTEMLISISSVKDLKHLLKEKPENPFILGGGSNVLFTKDYTGTILHINNKGIDVIDEDSQTKTIRVAAGEIWHEFVIWTIHQDISGVENLALIPGSVGAAPVQNIGAYGVEVKDVIISCQTINLDTLKITSYTNEACKFTYRNSIFKNKNKREIIISVDFKLKKPPHRLTLNYGNILETLKNKNILNPTLGQVAETVIYTRQSKLPDPKEIGNCGSFFKNAIINHHTLKQIQTQYPNIPFYKVEDDYKIPTAWLIESCGFKGYREGHVGVHNRQALVLVNYGNGSGKDILNLSEKIEQKVFDTFNIQIEREVSKV